MLQDIKLIILNYRFNRLRKQGLKNQVELCDWWNHAYITIYRS